MSYNTSYRIKDSANSRSFLNDKPIKKNNVSFIHYNGSFGKFKKVKILGRIVDIPFDINIPDTWIVNEKRYFDNDSETHRITGPITCGGCRRNGFWNGVFIAYCNVCAEIHDHERGLGLFRGLTDKGLPYEAEHCITNNLFGTRIYKLQKEKSMWNTYLKNIDLSLVGDQELKDKYKNGYFCDTKKEITGYYCDLYEQI